ncbi:MAG: hypothetical protein CSA95_05265 [Bacteroidetes bacterium]|nr:MAG: hypothetical protein CSA95_05265 [Bacteroidota bacterium]PIE88234.1 MAG: hypothetical protein CSA04_02945 [Bacteroidota bacterium]
MYFIGSFETTKIYILDEEKKYIIKRNPVDKIIKIPCDFHQKLLEDSYICNIIVCSGENIIMFTLDCRTYKKDYHNE